MVTPAKIVNISAAANAAAVDIEARGAARLLVMGGIALIVAGMVFGDLFAVFVLHQDAARIGRELLAATHAVSAHDPSAAGASLQQIGVLLEDRGTKVDAHAHAIAFGYLALLLAIAQPFIAVSPVWKKLWAAIFLAGATLLPIGVFLIHYVGLAYSPLASIGWASMAADFGGLLVIVALAAEAAGFWRWLRSAARPVEAPDRSWSARALLGGGALLILAGFLHGAWYSYFDLYQNERANHAVLERMLDSAAAGNEHSANDAVNDYGGLQAGAAVKIAAHSHIIEFGLLCMLLGFVQPLIFLSERWKRRWAVALLAGSVVLPVFVFLELRLGLLAGGIADAGGLLVVVSLTAMLAGVIRHTGVRDYRDVQS